MDKMSNWDALRIEDDPEDLTLMHSEEGREYFKAQFGNGVFMRLEHEGDIIWYYGELKPIGLSFTCAMERLSGLGASKVMEPPEEYING